MNYRALAEARIAAGDDRVAELLDEAERVATESGRVIELKESLGLFDSPYASRRPSGEEAGQLSAVPSPPCPMMRAGRGPGAWR